MVVCYIGLGSNVGDRQGFISAAIKKIRSLANTKVRTVSNTIESLPQGGPPQGPYLNAVLQIETDLNPYILLRELQRIESELGRIRTVLNGPRTIDLDILTFGDLCINEVSLCIPHPRILEREFVLMPLRQIDPDIIDLVRKLNKQNLKPAAGDKKKGKPAVKAKKSIINKKKKKR